MRESIMRDLHTGERRVFDKHISDNPVWHVKWKPFSINLKSITCNTLLPVHCWKWKWPKRGLAWTPLTRNSGFFLEPFFENKLKCKLHLYSMVDFLMIPFGLGRDTLYFLRLGVMLSGFKSPSHSRFALVRRRVLFLKKEGVAVVDLGERSGVSLFPFPPPPPNLWLFLPLAWNQNILTTVYGTFLLNLKYLKLSSFEITLRLFRLFRSFYFLNIIAKDK